MRKTVIILFFIFLATFAVFYQYDVKELFDRPLSYQLDRQDCPFCNEEVINQQVVYDGEQVRVLVNYLPIAEGHVLIMPKRHVARYEELNNAEFLEMGRTVQKMQRVFSKVYGKDDYVLIVQNGHFGGQTVNHTHMHMIPRGKESTLMRKIELWWVVLTELVGTRKPLSKDELHDEIQLLRDGVKNDS